MYWFGITIISIVYLTVALITEFGIGTLAVWPAAGIGLAGLMIFGIKAWPGIFIGSFFNVLIHFILLGQDPTAIDSLIIVIMTSIGNTLGAYIGMKLKPDEMFDQISFEKFSLITGKFIFTCLSIGFIPAIFGIGSYYLIGNPLDIVFSSYVFGWAISNIIGVLAVTPAVYLFYRQTHTCMKPLASGEGISILLITIFLSFFIVGPGYALIPSAFIHPSLFIAPLLWTTFRTPPLTVSFLNLLVFICVWTGTTNGYGYFIEKFPEGSETAMQSSLIMILCISLILGLLLLQRRREYEQQMDILEKKVAERTEELEKAKDIAENLARTDPMTKLNNRRAFFSYGEQIQNEAQRYSKKYCIIMLDIDHFKQVNDTYGHDIGDKTIIALAETIKEAIREVDVPGRIGGEEFAIILPETKLEKAMQVANRLKNMISEISITTPNNSFNFTVSMGISESNSSSKGLDNVLKIADEALYEAKENGRNRIVNST